jgi:putative ABC transport system permease protein
MESLLKDLQVAARQLFRQRASAAVVVATLGLAIGVNTLAFSFVNFFVFRPLPMKDVPRLVMIYGKHPEHGRDRARSSWADFVEWRAQSTSFESLAAARWRTFNLTGSGDPMRVRGFAATAELFEVWGLAAVRGRVILPADDRYGAARVALLSHGFWSRRFGSDPRVVGANLLLDGQAYTVVGVLAPSIEIGTLSEIDVWTPLTPATDPNDRTSRDLLVSGRLKPDVTIARAAAEIQSIVERQQRDHPGTNAGWGASVLPLRSALSGANTKVILALMGVAVSLVLAIACANVANLMLARGAARQRELAVRVALGAGRARIVRQLLTEGVVLAVLGGLLGVLLASWGLAFIRSVVFEPFFALVVVDRRVMVFSAVIALLSPLLFGLVPALRATRVDLMTSFKEAGGSVGPPRRRVRGRNLLVSGQLAVALALLLVAGLVVRSALAMRQLQVGFEHRRLLTMKVELPEAYYRDDAEVRAFVAQVEARLRDAPGVGGVATAAGRPVFEPGPSEPLAIDGRRDTDAHTRPYALRTVVGAGYFETLGIPVVEGRSFGERDRAGTEPSVIVNHALATRYFPGVDAVGRQIRIGGGDAPPRTIVGVAADVLNTDPGQPTLAEAYLPLAQQPVRSLVFLVRTDRTDLTVAAARRDLAALDPRLPLYDIKTMEQAFFEGLASDRVVTGMFILFASVALGLAILGLYSLIAYLVSQRTREMAVRIALGAKRSDVLRLVLGQGARLVAVGLAPGLLVGWALGRVMAGMLAGVSATDLPTFTLAPAGLAVVAMLASAVPAQRAARVEPARVLRGE